MKKWTMMGVGVVLLAISARGFAEASPANLVRLGGGVGFPSNGSGWVTDHLQTGYLASLSYDRLVAARWALEGGAMYLRNPVDTSGTPISELNLEVDTLGLYAAVRGDWLARKKFKLYSDIGIGYYQTSLYADGLLEDTATGWGIPYGLGGEFFLPKHFSLDLRVGYLPLFMSQGGSFNSLDVQLLAGYAWGKAQPRLAKPKEREPRSRL